MTGEARNLRSLPGGKPAPKAERRLVDADELADVLIGKMIHQDVTSWGQTLGMRPPPLPRDTESEWLVLGALYAGQIGADDVEELEHTDFFSRHGQAIAFLYLHIVRAGRRIERDRARVVATLEQAYPAGDVWERLVDDIEHMTPCFATPGVIEGHIAQVRLLADVRRLILALQGIEALCRAGHLTRAEIYQRGRDAFAPFRRSNP